MSSSIPQRPPLSHLLVTVLIAVAISLPISMAISWLVGVSGIPIPGFLFTGISGFIIGWRTSTVRNENWKRRQLRKQREEEDRPASTPEEGHYW